MNMRDAMAAWSQWAAIMRPGWPGLLVLASVVLQSGSPARAETLAHRAIAILNQVCVAPASPPDVAAVAERAAADSGWTLVKTGRRRGIVPPGRQPENPPLFVDKQWQIKDPVVTDGTLDLNMIGPEYPDYRLNVCSLSVPQRVFDDFVAETRSVLHLGPGRSDQGPDRALTTWALAGDGKTPDLGLKILTIAVAKQRAGWVTTAAVTDIKSHNGELPPGTKF